MFSLLHCFLSAKWCEVHRVAMTNGQTNIIIIFIVMFSDVRTLVDVVFVQRKREKRREKCIWSVYLYVLRTYVFWCVGCSFLAPRPSFIQIIFVLSFSLFSRSTFFVGFVFCLAFYKLDDVSFLILCYSVHGRLCHVSNSEKLNLISIIVTIGQYISRVYAVLASVFFWWPHIKSLMSTEW